MMITPSETSDQLEIKNDQSRACRDVFQCKNKYDRWVWILGFVNQARPKFSVMQMQIRKTQNKKNGPQALRLAALALATGAAIGTIYLPQPLIHSIGEAFGASNAAALPGMALLGYAAGVLALAWRNGVASGPRQIVLHGTALVAALLLLAAAPGPRTALVAALMIGLGASVTQRLVAAAAGVSAEHRGTTMAVVIASGLAGILVTRLSSDVMAEALGWRSVVALLAFLLSLAIPAVALALPAPSEPPAEPLTRVGALWAEPPALRSIVVSQAAAFGALQACWTALPTGLPDPGLRMGTTVVAGIVGIATALLAGRLATRFGMSRLAAAATVTALAGAVLSTSFGPFGVIAGLIMAEAGAQGALVANHVRAQASATARLQTAATLTFFAFLGGAAGSALAAYLGSAAAGLGPGLLLLSLSSSGVLGAPSPDPTLPAPAPRAAATARDAAPLRAHSRGDAAVSPCLTVRLLQ